MKEDYKIELFITYSLIFERRGDFVLRDDLRLDEHFLDAFLEDWLVEFLVYSILSPIEVKRKLVLLREQVDLRLWLDRVQLIRQVLTYAHRCFESVANRHFVVHDDQLVGCSVLFVLFNHGFEGLLTICCLVAGINESCYKTN